MDANPYFTHPKTGQRVYALIFVVENEKMPGVEQQIIVWLTPEGDGIEGRTRPDVPGKRLVTTQPGQWIINGRVRCQIKSLGCIGRHEVTVGGARCHWHDH